MMPVRVFADGIALPERMISAVYYPDVMTLLCPYLQKRQAMSTFKLPNCPTKCRREQRLSCYEYSTPFVFDEYLYPMMNIVKNLPELVRDDVITQDTADQIRDYYQRKESSSPNRLFIVFGILGAILTGLGIILIIAHNWDELSRATKTIFSFLPLLIGQIFCAYALWKREESDAWRESAATFLFFAVGASISLVSQVYHIPGNLSSFLLTWMALCIPLVYVMRSSVASLLYLAGITYYAVHNSYWTYPASEPYIYWLLLVLVLPYYYQLGKNKPRSNYMVFHNWLVPLSLVITLGAVAISHEELMFPAYISLFGLLYLIGNSSFFPAQEPKNGSYQFIGSVGTIALLLALSFAEFWEDLRQEQWTTNEIVSSPEFIATVLISGLAATLLYRQYRRERLRQMKPLEPVFLLFIVLFVLGIFSPAAVVLTNLLVFFIGIATIREGARKDHLGILNYGLLIIAALVICRFFDTDLSFVARGVLFVLVGLGFFILNYWTLQKRKLHEP